MYVLVVFCTWSIIKQLQMQFVCFDRRLLEFLHTVFVPCAAIKTLMVGDSMMCVNVAEGQLLIDFALFSDLLTGCNRV